MDEMPVGLSTQAVQHGAAVPRMPAPWEALESAVRLTEGAEAALAVPSATGLMLALLDLLLRPGDRVVASRGLAPRLAATLAARSRRIGTAVVWADDAELEAAAAVRPAPRLVIAATPSAPALGLPSVRRLAAAVYGGGGLLLVDNTLMTGLNHRALDLGADLVLHHSLGVWCGDGAAEGALLAGRRSLVAEMRGMLGETNACRASGALGLGLATLPLRLARQADNALEVATFLRHQPQVTRVHFPGLPDYPHRDVYRNELQGPGFVLAFQVSGSGGFGTSGTAGGSGASVTVEGGVPPAQRLVASLRLCRAASGPGGAASFAFRPVVGSASDPFRRERARDMVWLAVGLEDASDLADDLSQALISL